MRLWNYEQAVATIRTPYIGAVAKIRRIEMRGDIASDEVLYDAVLRNLQTLSEATQLLPEEKTSSFPTIPWREISGFRNILVHNYLGDIDPLTVSAVIAKHLQPLEECVRAMLAQDSGSEND